MILRIEVNNINNVSNTKDDFIIVSYNEIAYKRLFNILDSNISPPIVKRQKRNINCSLYRWYLDFDTLNWSQIHSPRGYYANYCRGSCNTNIDNTTIITNHAYTKNLYLFHTGEDIPPSCCVPIKLSSINVNYSENNRFNITEIKEMVVDKCGCL